MNAINDANIFESAKNCAQIRHDHGQCVQQQQQQQQAKEMHKICWRGRHE